MAYNLVLNGVYWTNLLLTFEIGPFRTLLSQLPARLPLIVEPADIGSPLSQETFGHQRGKVILYQIRFGKRGMNLTPLFGFYRLFLLNMGAYEFYILYTPKQYRWHGRCMELSKIVVPQKDDRLNIPRCFKLIRTVHVHCRFNEPQVPSGWPTIWDDPHVLEFLKFFLFRYFPTVEHFITTNGSICLAR